MTETNTDMMIGLKTQVKRQVGLKKNAVEYGEFLESQLISSCRMMLMNGIGRGIVSRFIWDMVEKASINYMIETQSERIGVYTTIAEYTNEKGRKHMAHFTSSGKYLGTVKNLGDKPVSYKTYIDVEEYQSYLEIDFCRILSGETTQIVDVFKFK